MTNLEYELFWYKIAILFYTNYWIVTLTLFILPPLCFFLVCLSVFTLNVNNNHMQYGYKNLSIQNEYRNV